MTLCIDILRTFSCIIRVFYSFVLFTVHRLSRDSINATYLLFIHLYFIGACLFTIAV